IGAREPGVKLLEAVGVGEGRDTLARRDPEWVPALRTDTTGSLDFRAIDDFLAGVALDPQPLAHLHGARRACVVRLLATEPGTHADFLSGALSCAMKAPTSSTRVALVARSSIILTIAEPTTTPSASAPTAATCDGFAMPKPTQMGFVVTMRSPR